MYGGVGGGVSDGSAYPIDDVGVLCTVPQTSVFGTVAMAMGKNIKNRRFLFQNQPLNQRP